MFGGFVLEEWFDEVLLKQSIAAAFEQPVHEVHLMHDFSEFEQYGVGDFCVIGLVAPLKGDFKCSLDIFVRGTLKDHPEEHTAAKRIAASLGCAVLLSADDVDPLSFLVIGQDGSVTPCLLDDTSDDDDWVVLAKTVNEP